jgi:hypothetical protein
VRIPYTPSHRKQVLITFISPFPHLWEADMAKDIYQELRKQLDMYSLGFPATESGIELKILKKLFRKDDA